MDPVGPEGSTDSRGPAPAKTSGISATGLVDGNTGSGGGSRFLHPELQARLQRMGISRRGSAALVGTITTGANSESTDNHKAGEHFFEADAVASNVGDRDNADERLPSARDASLDDMLLQLSDLDARSRALQAQGEQMSRKLDESKQDRGQMASARRTRSNGEARSRQCDESRSDNDATGGNRGASPSSAAQAVVKQHPLQGLTLMTATGDFQRHGPRQRRHERPPMAPVTVPGVAAALGKEHRSSGRRSLSLATAASTACVARESPRSVPPPPSGARVSEKKCDRVALPPLKPSTSAPGRLNGDGGPWARCRGL